MILLEAGGFRTFQDISITVSFRDVGVDVGTKIIRVARQTTIVLGTLSNATRVFKNGISKEIRQIESKGAIFFWGQAANIAGRWKHLPPTPTSWV